MLKTLIVMTVVVLGTVAFAVYMDRESPPQGR